MIKILKGALLGGAMVAASIASAAFASDEKPKYGGGIEIGTVYVTLSALSWDANDFNWKHNHDTGLVYEQLFAADLGKSVAIVDGAPQLGGLCILKGCQTRFQCLSGRICSSGIFKTFIVSG